MDLELPPMIGPEAGPTCLGKREKSPEGRENLPFSEEMGLDEPRRDEPAWFVSHVYCHLGTAQVDDIIKKTPPS